MTDKERKLEIKRLREENKQLRINNNLLQISIMSIQNQLNDSIKELETLRHQISMKEDESFNV